MRKEKNFTKTKIILICLVALVLVLGTSYALARWSSGNTTLSGSTMCFNIIYSKGQDIDFGTRNSSGVVVNGMTASLAFDESKAASTSVSFARQNDCLLYGKGTISVNITASGADLTKGALKYIVYNSADLTTELKKGSIVNSGETVIYDNFDITDVKSVSYTIYFWLDAGSIDNSYLETTFSGTIGASAVSTTGHE